MEEVEKRPMTEKRPLRITNNNAVIAHYGKVRRGGFAAVVLAFVLGVIGGLLLTQAAQREEERHETKDEN